ncbi:MAG: ABC transporter permease [Candidatus Margulisiibacteriota bacterium]|jgi:ABC-2 type transport system permease protein
MNRIFYLMQKEFRQIFREKANIMLIFLMPFIQPLIFGYAITLDVKNIDIAVLDNDNSVISRNLIDTVHASNLFNLKDVTLSQKKAIEDIDNNKIKLSLNIPNNFERDLKLGLKPELQVLLDGVDGNTAGISLDYILRLLSKNQERIIKNHEVQLPNNNYNVINIIPRILYNPSLESKFNIVPGLIVILLTMITLLLTAINLVKEKEIGTLEQLMVTPITKMELIIGKILPFVILGFIMINIGILTAGLIFGIWLKGNLFLLYFFSFLYMLTTLGLGILISTITSTQQQAMFLSWFIIVFSVILSGFFIPIENMPPIIQLITYLNPARYFMIVIRSIYLKDAGVFNLWQELISMLIFGLACISLAIFKFQKRVN